MRARILGVVLASAVATAAAVGIAASSSGTRVENAASPRATVAVAASSSSGASSSTGSEVGSTTLATAACSTCHAAESAEWEASRHAAAWRDPIFQSEFAHGRPAWCVGCHAPLAPDPTAPSDADPRVTAGVACAACHERAGHMVSARRAANSPHETIVDAEFGSAAFCARCHQFNFPILGERGRLVHYTDEPMQATVDEWRASGVGEDCVDCHAGHGFRGSHDPARVASAVAISICRSRAGLEVAVTNRGAGHNVPSGGVHRRMVVRAWRSNAPERFAEYTLGRKFRALSGGGKETIRDTTIAPGATRRARFSLATLGNAPSDAAVNVELRYIYALDEHVQLATDVSKQIWYARVEPSELPACAVAP